MPTVSIGRRGRLLLVASALVGALALPAAASADTINPPSISPAASRDATITVTSVSMTGKVVVNVGIAFVCQPFEIVDWSTGETVQSTQGSIENAQVVVLQAQGKIVASGQSTAFGGPAICDGITANTISVPVSATVSPWKNGTAVVGALVFIAEPTQFQDSDFASSGPIAFRLSR